MKLTTTVTAPVLDMFSSDWEFDGKKGTSHFVVIYDFENHTSERLIVDINNDKLFQLIGNIELLKEYKLTVVLNEAYGKLRKELVGVEELEK